MLQITVPDTEIFDDQQQRFIKVKGKELQLEHSLVSVKKWESKWKRPFLGAGNGPQNTEETLDYVRCMTITQCVDPNVYRCLTMNDIRKVREYIDDPMTATTIKELPNRKMNRSVITAEIIYYWMIKLEIPSEYQKWHLNQLLTLIRVFDEKDSPNKKKMSKSEIAKQRRALNASRRAKHRSRG